MINDGNEIAEFALCSPAIFSLGPCRKCRLPGVLRQAAERQI